MPPQATDFAPAADAAPCKGLLAFMICKATAIPRWIETMEEAEAAQARPSFLHE
jgi:hypothetical protein